MDRLWSSPLPSCCQVHPDWRASSSSEGRDRTGDTTIFSRVLYQLSYLAEATSKAIRYGCGLSVRTEPVEGWSPSIPASNEIAPCLNR